MKYHFHFLPYVDDILVKSEDVFGKKILVPIYFYELFQTFVSKVLRSAFWKIIAYE